MEAIKITPDGHGIRFDVYFKDDKNTIFDIEMQMTRKDNIPKRSRYYQGMLDLNYLKEGSENKYSRLPQSYIVFLCNFDLFGMGYHKYSFEPMCNEVENLKLEDGTCRVFICTDKNETSETNKETRRDISTELSDFLKYIETGIADNNTLATRLEAKVREAVKSERWRAEYMSLQDIIDEEREEGREEGMAIGELRNRVKLIISKLKKGKSISVIADELEDSDDNIQLIVKVIKEYAPDNDIDKIVDELMAAKMK